DYFCAEYSRGLTPNPSIASNQHLKFRILLDKALSLDAQLATGHYARIERTLQGYRLLRARDSLKDQTYFLFTLGQSELAHLLFPIGDLLKKDVRALATEFGLPVADKAESQDLCFVPDGDYRAFLSRRLELRPGEIVDRHQHSLGKHSGTALYTVGQRRGLNLSSEEPLYVLAVDAPANRVIVGHEDLLLQDEAWIDRVNWVSGSPPDEIGVTVKIRYQSPQAAATLTPVHGPDAIGVRLRFLQPQRAIAPGQAAVFYDGDEVLGGGIIRLMEPAWGKSS
ncbi:MAG: tRNA 2-thiouridine(34) synthase MnmA, partial [Dehalococcoidia bacterium]|nr:tRNA 2-thiouridine(34) synthase MnmA [Dehalococcoidia bacterium]